MQPKQGSYTVKIPLTVDGSGRNKLLGDNSFIVVILIFAAWLFIGIILHLAIGFLGGLLWSTLLLVVVTLIVRYLVLHEKYFKKKREELLEKNFKFDYNVFWGIHEIRDKYPHFVYFNNGLKAVFVSFDKDVIVGRKENADYHHYEAISNAYQQMVKRGIECVHIDYMDSVGNDPRMDSLFKNAFVVKNEDLKKVLTRVYDNVRQNMSNSFASYDVYCFYFKGKEDLFWYELQAVLQQFESANYIRFRVMNRDDIAELVKSVMNIDNFSVSKACESIVSDSMSGEYIRVLWVERDGERVILNKTTEEIQEDRRVLHAEKVVKRSNKKTKRKQAADISEIDLFEDN